MTTTTDTSLAAYRAKKSTAWVDRQRIEEYARSQGINGTTCDQAEIALNMSHQTCSARFTDMSDKKKGENRTLFPSGEIRPTRSGHGAIVFVTKEFR